MKNKKSQTEMSKWDIFFKWMLLIAVGIILGWALVKLLTSILY